MNKLYTSIKAIRISKGITQDEISEKLSMTQGNYTRIESGKTQLTIERIEQLANIFEMSVTALIQYDKDNLTESKGDVEYLLKHIDKLEKETLALNKRNEETKEDKYMSFDFLKREIEVLKSKAKETNEKAKQLQAEHLKELEDKELRLAEKDRAIADRDRMILMLEKTISILENQLATKTP